MISTKRMAAFTKLLGFEKYDGLNTDSFVRNGKYERTFLYIFENGKKKQWKMKFVSRDANYYYASEVIMNVKTEEDILTNYCKWYFDKAVVDTIANASDIIMKAKSDITRLKRGFDGVWY